MITSLRRKFIMVAMLSTLVVLAAIMGTVNISNYVKMVKRADSMTALLAHDESIFEEADKDAESDADSKAEETSEAETSEETDKSETPPEKPDGESKDESGYAPENAPNTKEAPADKPALEKDGMGDDGISPETPYDTRYFKVTVDEDGEVVSSDLDRIAAVDEDTAAEYAESLEGKKENASGFTGVYRYLVTENDDGSTTYIFLDCRKEILSFRNVLLTSVTVSVLGLGAVLVLVLFFSKLVFRPVEESFRKQKQFITDASHELKTPLTIIDANTEVMEMVSGENQWTKSTRKQVHRLTGMVQQMVTLTRLDEGRDADEMAEFSFSDALEESLAPYEAPARVSGKQLDLSIERNISYVGNERSIRQLVGILADNAVKYTPEGGTIRVELKKKGKKILLDVSNDAKDVPQGKLDVLFERFYRLDSSRNSKTGGSGIGLSIAQAVVQQHKGKITAESPDGRSLFIHVIL